MPILRRRSGRLRITGPDDSSTRDWAFGMAGGTSPCVTPPPPGEWTWTTACSDPERWLARPDGRVRVTAAQGGNELARRGYPE
jgi:hypothetical protein